MAIQCRYLRVDFVCDQYPVQNIKNCQRGGIQVIHIKNTDQKTPKRFNKYLANGRTNELTIEFLFQCSTRFDPGILGIILLVSHDEVCPSIVVNDPVVPTCSQITRKQMHGFSFIPQAAQVFSSVTIKRPDTAGMVLTLAKSQDFHGCLMLFVIASGNNNRINHITEVGIKLGQYKCQANIGLHIFTACDRISGFKGKGNKKPLGLMLESEAFCSEFMAFGSGWKGHDVILPDVEKFVCALYVQKYSAGVNATGYTYFD